MTSIERSGPAEGERQARVKDGSMFSSPRAGHLILMPLQDHIVLFPLSVVEYGLFFLPAREISVKDYLGAVCYDAGRPPIRPAASTGCTCASLRHSTTRPGAVLSSPRPQGVECDHGDNVGSSRLGARWYERDGSPLTSSVIATPHHHAPSSTPAVCQCAGSSAATGRRTEPRYRS